MNFEYNEDQLAIKEMAKNFSETEFKPYASEWDQKEIFPVESLKKLLNLDWQQYTLMKSMVVRGLVD